MLSVIGAVILVGGMALLTVVGPTTALGFVTLTMIVIGAGVGVINPIFTLAVQNAIPAGRLGVGTGAITYLRTTGSTIGTAIFATLVVNISASRLPSLLPAAARTLSSSILAQATNQQVLVDPGKQHLIVQAAIRQAPTQAHQISQLFAQIFAAGRQALAAGLHMGFLVLAGVSIAMFILTLFLKDVTLRKTAAGIPEKQNVEGEVIAAVSLTAESSETV